MLEKFEDQLVLVFFLLQSMITINVTSHQSSQLDTPAEGNCALWVILDGYTNVMKDDALFPPDDDV